MRPDSENSLKRRTICSFFPIKRRAINPGGQSKVSAAALPPSSSCPQIPVSACEVVLNHEALAVKFGPDYITTNTGKCSRRISSETDAIQDVRKVSRCERVLFSVGDEREVSFSDPRCLSLKIFRYFRIELKKYLFASSSYTSG